MTIISKIRSPRYIVSLGQRLYMPLNLILPLTKVIRTIQFPIKYINRKIKAVNIKHSVIAIDKEKGYFEFNINEVESDGGTNLISTCQNIIESKMNLGKYKKNKPYLIVITEPEDLTENKILLEFALNEKLTKSIAGYLGTVPMLSNIRIWVCPPNNTNDEGSQQFHIDQEDLKQIKVFVNLNNVTHDSGPLSFLPASASKKAYKKLDKPYHRVTDDLMFSHVDEKDVVTFVGKPGDAMGVDTSRCYHRGSRMTKNERRVLVLQYVSCHEIMETPPFVSKEAFDEIELSEWQKLVLPQHDYNYIN